MKLKSVKIGDRCSIPASALGKNHEAPVVCIKLFGHQVKEINSGKISEVDGNTNIL